MSTQEQKIQDEFRLEIKNTIDADFNPIVSLCYNEKVLSNVRFETIQDIKKMHNFSTKKILNVIAAEMQQLAEKSDLMSE